MKGFYPEGYGQTADGAKRKKYTMEELKDAMIRGDVLEAVAYMCDSDHNLLVDLGCIRGVIPRVEGALGIAEGTTRDIAIISRVGKSVCFTVEEISAGYALLSRRRAQQLCKEQFLNGLKCGDVIKGKVTHMETFGAFLDIGCGNVALLPIDAISVSRISHPADRFRTGDDLRVIIKNVDSAGRITLSHKELLGSWEENATNFSQGETVSGIVRSIETYGIFIELAPNLAGLAEPKEGVRVGQRASVYIKSVIPEKMKVKLIIIDSFETDTLIPFHYYFEGEHIDKFTYSPPSCEKNIETVF
ncbi:MAG: S1 RNA-binding domain-containing protein [Acutalibacteraceae bacterium]|nr:S1 RNA-binding domain-containing protein [Acutalibacteraceae bacterium]